MVNSEVRYTPEVRQREYEAVSRMMRHEGASRQSYPIRYIFNLEFGAMAGTGRLPETKKDIISTYEHRYVSTLINTISDWLCFGNAATLNPADWRAFSKAVNCADEKELFERLSKTFHVDLEASYQKDTLLIESTVCNVFDCYASTALFTDVLLRLGKPVTIVIIPEHMLLRGETHAFETTNTKRCPAFPIEEFEHEHPGRQEGGSNLLLSVAHLKCAYYFGDLSKTLDSNSKAIGLNQRDMHAWAQKGRILEKMAEKCISESDRQKKLEEALEAYKTYENILEQKQGISKDMYEGARKTIGNVLAKMKRFEEASDT